MGCGTSSSALSKEDLELLKKKTNFTEEGIQRWHRVFMKECPSGQLTKKKFVEVYKNMFPDGKSGDFYQHMFRTFDKDNSGALSFIEFMMAIYVTNAGTPEEVLELAFHLYDINNNNQIESREIAEILKAMYLLKGSGPEDVPQELDNLCESQAIELIAKMDLDNNGVLSKEEFIKGCMGENEILKVLSGPA